MPKIDVLYAYIVADKAPDDEGVPAVQMPDGMIMPLMGADMPRVDSVRRIAQSVADREGKPIKLVKFTNPEVIEILEPKQ